MTTTAALVPSPDSFYAPVAPAPREDLLRAYLSFLDARNGPTTAEGGFAHRDDWLRQTAAWTTRHHGEVDTAAFDRNYTRFDRNAGLSPAVLALLAFVKVNAGEAYGVEVITRARHGAAPPSETDLFAQVERVVAQEETYHTRILLSAGQHFGVAPRGPWRPPLPLKVLISVLAHTPKSMFHPVLLGAEISGVYTFQWLLRRVAEVFRDEPELRDALEQRLVEVLVDEVGHIAFNRMAVGPAGLVVARHLASLVALGVTDSTPEFVALGWGRDELRALSQFDLRDLPHEVRRRAFYA